MTSDWRQMADRIWVTRYSNHAESFGHWLLSIASSERNRVTAADGDDLHRRVDSWSARPPHDGACLQGTHELSLSQADIGRPARPAWNRFVHARDTYHVIIDSREVTAVIFTVGTITAQWSFGAFEDATDQRRCHHSIMRNRLALSCPYTGYIGRNFNWWNVTSILPLENLKTVSEKSVETTSGHMTDRKQCGINFM